MPAATSEGIIIKRTNFGEADRILTIVTPFKGKIRVLAKGVRRITSRRGGNVELLNKLKFQIFTGAGLPILTEAESIQTYPKIKSDIILSAYASHITELMERLLPEDQPNLACYKLLNSVLDLLEKNPRQIFIRAFEVKILTVLGFWSLNQIDASDKIKHLLDLLLKDSWQELAGLQLDAETALEVERILRYYIEGILEASLRSVKVLQKIKEN
ncbi:DNA repair protein RecO [Patescibacteria group bacterium]|nr:DNA repair protein RecO [Patescibacteria group bacterium]MCL5409402.1 DNA repair protein RecO [Patescibacteria group bacterium]